MNIIKIVIAGIMLALTLMSKAEVQITNVEAQQRYPWNGKVDIRFMVNDVGPEWKMLRVRAIDTELGVTNYAQHVTGDTSYSNGLHHVVWDMTADGCVGMSTNVIFGVSFWDPLYCVVDLSGGTNTTSYSVCYFADIPDEGWTDEYKTSKLVLRRVVSGEFTMGSPSREPRSSGEQQHQVTLTKGFWIGVFELTQRQWELIVGNRPSYFTNGTYYATRPVEQVSYAMIRGDRTVADWPSMTTVASDSFIGVLRRKTGIAFDLPTEAQWEYSCRAGTGSSFSNGKNIVEYRTNTGAMEDIGRNRYNGGLIKPWSDIDAEVPERDVDASQGTASVGLYNPNNWGLYDMHGNVYEWCLDGYDAFGSLPVVDPVGSTQTTPRIIRGGAFGSYDSDCRSASRSFFNGSDDNTETSATGLRICCPCL